MRLGFRRERSWHPVTHRCAEATRCPWHVSLHPQPDVPGRTERDFGLGGPVPIAGAGSLSDCHLHLFPPLRRPLRGAPSSSCIRQSISRVLPEGEPLAAADMAAACLIYHSFCCTKKFEDIVMGTR